VQQLLVDRERMLQALDRQRDVVGLAGKGAAVDIGNGSSDKRSS
jgi:hypothetical protein